MGGLLSPRVGSSILLDVVAPFWDIQVAGDRIWLNGTTIDEVEVAHKATLQLVLDETNHEYGEYLSEQNLKQEGELAEPKSSQVQVREAARKIKFD
jgi:heat shock protein HspQ